MTTVNVSGQQRTWVDNAVLGVLLVLVVLTGYAAFAADQPWWTAAAMATCILAGTQLGRRRG